jgi:hypothetical protein
MSLIRIDHNPSRHKVALSATLWTMLLGSLGLVLLIKTDSLPAAAAVWTAALLLAAAGWLLPGPTRILYLAVTYATLPFWLVVSPVVLAVVYYLVLTPTGLLMRLFGYDPMQRRFDPDAKTYWLPREQHEDVSRYFRQF